MITANLPFPHAFFPRTGGVSEGIYASLNCGYGSGDDKISVRENRSRVANAFGMRESQVLTCYQIHSADVATVTSPWTPDTAPQADAMVTDTPGIVLGILTADCTPILFADEEARVIGAAHAGWKGAIGGVAEATIAAMERLGAKRERIGAAIGPCIGQKSYEVGPEFIERFIAADAGYARYFNAHHFDLRGFVASRLEACGITRVEVSPHDTCAEEAEFFSYRRTTLRKEPAYGRQISCITLEKQA